MFRQLTTAATRVLEVERKFIASPALLGVLRRADAKARSRTFTDVYFDSRGDWPLTTQDAWLRLRNSTWELKLQHSSVSDSPRNAGIDRYLELTDERDILHHVSRLLSLFRSYSPYASFGGRTSGLLEKSLLNLPIVDALAAHGVAAFASITTTRTRYNLGDGLGVDADEVLFDGGGHYAIAEVEVVVPFEAANGSVLGITMSDYEDALQLAEDRIAQFAATHDLPSTPVRGKVLECIARQDASHYAALGRAGLLAAKLGAPTESAYSNASQPS